MAVKFGAKKTNTRSSVHNSHKYYPNMSVLSNMLTIQTVNQYPKLAILIFEVLQPYIEVFNNKYISFWKLCQQQKIIDQSNFDNNNIDMDLQKKRIKLSEGASKGREAILDLFLKKYKKVIMDEAKKKVDEQEANDSNNKASNI